MISISATQKKLAILFGLLFVLIASVAVASFYPTTTNQGYDPIQPIPFSHKLHAGMNKIPCAYCHTGVEKSRHATIPAMNVCMNCHRAVKTDSPWIQKLTAMYEKNEPIQWVRVHELPDFVYFPHKRHVLKGVACEVCHGNVKEMDRIEQFAPLTMGFCLDCHRGQTTPRNVMAQFALENPAAATANTRYKPVATTSCSACHH